MATYGRNDPPVAATAHLKPILNKATSEAIRYSYQSDLSRLLVDFPEIDGLRWPTVADGRPTDERAKLTVSSRAWVNSAGRGRPRSD